MLPVWVRPWMAWAAAVAALAVLLGLQTLRLAAEITDHANTRADYREQVAVAEKAARLAVEGAREEERRRTLAAQEIANETQTRLEAARADADASRAAGERLRARLAELAAARRGGGAAQPAAAGAGPAAAVTADLLADVQRRLDEAADGIAGFADRAHGAGVACQRLYGETLK